MNLRKRFGQHFLRDPAVIEALLNKINPQADEKILEIGPGEGALTAPLLRAQSKLTAIEIDRDLAAVLRRQFGERLRLIVGDALQEDLSHLSEGARVVGNLPYNIATPLLLKLVQCRAKEMWLMVQKEVGQRVCASPGGSDYGRLTVSVQLFCTVSEELSVSPQAFMPPPKVQSSVLRLAPVAVPPTLPPLFFALLAAAFQSRRKILSNALSAFCVNWQQADIAPERRPQTLSPAEFIRLAAAAKAPDEDL